MPHQTQPYPAGEAFAPGTAMPAFRAVFTPDQLRDIAGYTSTTLAKK